MDLSDMKLANQLCFSAYNVNRLFGQFYEQQLKQFGLTFSQYLVLLTLWEQSPQTLNAIGQQLDLSSNTLTPLLKRLEQAGWVTRHNQTKTNDNSSYPSPNKLPSSKPSQNASPQN